MPRFPKCLCTNKCLICEIKLDAILVCVRFFRYSRKLIVADLYRLPEVVAVREQGGSRLVCLLPSSQVRQSPLGSSQSQEGSSSASGSPVVFEELEYHEPVCRQHYKQNDFRSVLVCVILRKMFTLNEIPLDAYFTTTCAFAPHQTRAREV